MLKIRCKSCDKKISVPEKYAGKKGKCPGCGAAVRIPTLESLEQAKPKPKPKPKVEKELDAYEFDDGPDLSALSDLEAQAGGDLQSVDADESAKPKAKAAAAVTAGLAGAPGAAAAAAGKDTPLPKAAVESETKVCPGCGGQCNGSAKICVSCGHGFTGMSAQKRAVARKGALLAGRSGMAIGGGLLTALACGFIWAAIARYTGYQFGWMAWLLGLGVGVCVALVSGTKNDLVGLAAAFVALLGWGFGKFLILAWALPVILAAEAYEDYEGENYREEHIVYDLYFDDELSDEMVDGWEDGDLNEAEKKELDEKMAAWVKTNGEPPDPGQAAVEDYKSLPLWLRLIFVIGCSDILWIVLMLGSAWKIGSGRDE